MSNDLAQVPGNFVADGMNQRPPAAPGLPDQVVELDCGMWGRFRVNRVHSGARRQGVEPFWVADHAELVL